MYAYLRVDVLPMPVLLAVALTMPAVMASRQLTSFRQCVAALVMDNQALIVHYQVRCFTYC